MARNLVISKCGTVFVKITYVANVEGVVTGFSRTVQLGIINVPPVQVSNRRCRSLKGEGVCSKCVCWARIWQNDLSATALVVVEVRFAS